MTERLNEPTPGELLAARLALGITQHDAAALLGMHRATWSRYEDGLRTLSAIEWRYWLHVAGIEAIPFQRRRLPSAKATK